MKVIKRDGRMVPFTRERIENAVKAAGLTAERAHEFAESFAYPNRNLAVWEIQAQVEKELIEQGYLTVAEKYVEYRFNKDLDRKRLADSVEKLQSKDESVVHENGNKDSDQFHTQRDLTSGAVAKAIGLSMLPPEVAEAHQDGTLYWHK